MASWIESGRLVEAILALTVVEWLALALFHTLTGRGVAPAEFWRNLVSGMALLVALRESLVGAWWGWIAVCLSVALVAHLADLARRWGR